MTLKAIAVQGLTLAHGSGSPITGGVFVITSTPSTKIKVESKGVFFSPLAYTFSGGSTSGTDPGTVTGGGSIAATATKVKDISGKFVMRVDDIGTMTAGGTLGGSPVAVSGPVEISAAGQSKVRAQ